MLKFILLVCFDTLLIVDMLLGVVLVILWQVDRPNYRGDWQKFWKFRELVKIWNCWCVK